MAFLALALGLVVAAAALMLFKSTDRWSKEWIGLLLAGPPEMLCLLAVAILGRENYRLVVPKMRRSPRSSDVSRPTSRLRYYAGLAGCLFNGLPLYLFSYVPQVMPEGIPKYLTLVLADLVFFGSLFFAGGELWEKIRRVFIWESED